MHEGGTNQPAPIVYNGTMYLTNTGGVIQALNKRTDKTWPTTWFVPRTTGSDAFRDVYTVMARWGANHGAISYGHIGADLITLASMLRIPVHMHNVPEEKCFRPHAWGSFANDHHACAVYGPLYR